MAGLENRKHVFPLRYGNQFLSYGTDQLITPDKDDFIYMRPGGELSASILKHDAVAMKSTRTDRVVIFKIMRELEGSISPAVAVYRSTTKIGDARGFIYVVPREDYIRAYNEIEYENHQAVELADWERLQAELDYERAAHETHLEELACEEYIGR